ncbi:hypothetical protein Tco_0869378 [Tanacetum coccineum]
MLSFRKFREGDISFRDRVFPEKMGEYVKNIDLLSVIEDEERFTNLSDEDSIRVCLLLSLEVIFMGHELGSTVDNELYAAIRNVNSKHKDAHHKALEINPNFVPSFFVWISPVFQGHFWSKHLPFQKWEYFGQLFSQNRVKALEGLCESLMILPKEMESFKAHVYKLETIIHVITRKTKGTNLKHKVNTVGQKDKVESVGKQYDLGDKYWDAFNDLVDANGVVEVDNYLTKIFLMLVEQRRQRLKLRLEGENDMKSIEFSNSTHMKLALERCGTTKRRYVNVLMPPMEVDTDLKIPSMDTLKNQKDVLDAFMIERCQDLKSWEEDSLIGFDDNRLGWLRDKHIDLWVRYMWHFSQSSQDWSMVSCYFLMLLLQESMPLFYATDEIYPLA